MLRQWQQRVLNKEPTGSAFGGSQRLPLCGVIERDFPLVAYKLNRKLSQFKLVTATNTKQILMHIALAAQRCQAR